MKDVKLELDEIELQQQGLERQGVRLEQLIRDKCESRHGTEGERLSTGRFNSRVYANDMCIRRRRCNL